MKLKIIASKDYVPTPFDRVLNYLKAATEEFAKQQDEVSFRRLQGAMGMMERQLKERGQR